MAGGLGVYLAMGQADGVWWRRVFGAVHLNIWDILVLGFLLTVLGAVGDLVESLIKRAVAVKDSAGIVPGLGGFLDMFDSLLYTAPVMFFYVRAFGL